MILIIDNYDSFVYNIVHYIDYDEKKIVVIRNDKLKLDEIDQNRYGGIIISPGPMGPSDAGLSNMIIDKYKDKIPILGICLGHQCIGHVFGSSVKRHYKPTHGKKSEVTLKDSPIFEGIKKTISVARYHSLYISSEGFNYDELKITGTLSDGTIMSIEHNKYKIFGVQFHPESILTGENGKIILRNFLKIASLN